MLEDFLPSPDVEDNYLLAEVLDGIFVLELFIGATSHNDFIELAYSHHGRDDSATYRRDFIKLGYPRHDPVFGMRSVMHTVQRDMIMLENQIPLVVLDRLLATQLGRPERPNTVATLAIRFFNPLMPTEELLHERDSGGLNAAFDPLSGPGLHCLDAFRHSLLRNTSEPDPPPSSFWRIWSTAGRVADKRRKQFTSCVSELQKGGIRCRKRGTDRFWDIKFENGVLQIPKISIHDGTKSLFLNLIAFEQCHLDSWSNKITSYLIFMDNLIYNEQDVRYLHQKGIIEHWLGNDKEVADLFSRLTQEVAFDFKNSYLSDLCTRVKEYRSSKRHIWITTLRRNYFSNPWAIISFVAGVVLLLMTFAQTFYTVYPYYQPRQ